MKKLTISSDNPATSGSPASNCGSIVNMGKNLTTAYIITLATAAVQVKVTSVIPSIFPALRGLAIFAIADDIEQKTMGTTTQNIIFTKRVPSGSRAVAPGHTAPTMHPAAIPVSMVSRNQ